MSEPCWDYSDDNVTERLSSLFEFRLSEWKFKIKETEAIKAWIDANGPTVPKEVKAAIVHYLLNMSTNNMLL